MQLTSQTLPTLLSFAIEPLQQMPQTELVKQQGAAFEPLLVKAIESSIIRHGFNNIEQVELVSGHRFPDIVIHTTTEKLGIEVKTSKGKGWSTLGGSIFESTRIKGVDCIYLFFANFSNAEKAEFRFKPIEACISDVVITHKPRYAIDLDTEQTFFDKSSVSYQQLQNATNPFALIRNYMKNKAGENAELWWISDDENDNFDVNQLGPQSIRNFSSLTKMEKTQLIDEMYALFPEILSTSTQKYEKLALYLVAKKGIVYPSLRDAFSAGGKHRFNDVEIPKYFKVLTEPMRLQHIGRFITMLHPDLIDEYWGTTADQSRIEIWLEKVSQQIHSNDKLCNSIKPQLIKHITAGIQDNLEQ